MRTSRSLSTRIATVGGALALAASGLVGAVGLGAVASVTASTPAGATTTKVPASTSTQVPPTTCNLLVGTTVTPTVLTPTVTAGITPSPVSAGSTYSLNPLQITSVLDPATNPTLAKAAGYNLQVVFTGTLSATGATPATEPVTFTGTQLLPGSSTVPWTNPVTITLPGTAGPFTATSGVTSSAVSLSGTGKLTATVLNGDGTPSSLSFDGPCTGSAVTQIASVPVVQPAAQVLNVIPNSGLNVGGTTVKIVGQHLSGAQSIVIAGVPAASFQTISPNVIEAVTGPGPNVPGTGDGNAVDSGPVVVTTLAGPPTLTGRENFNYVDQTQSAIVTGVSPQAGTVGGGSQVTITGVGFNDVADGDGPVTDVFFGSTDVPITPANVISNTEIQMTAPPGTGIVNVQVLGAGNTAPDDLSPISDQDRFNYAPGYFLGAGDGGVFSYGQVPGVSNFFGSAGNLTLNKPVVGMATSPDGGGYWLVAADGGVFAYGDAVFYGSAGNLKLNQPVVAIIATPDGAGYWLVAADGGIFAYGDALFYGSTGGLKLNAPIVGGASGQAVGQFDAGYYLVAADGGVFAYGPGATFAGSAGGTTLNKPVVGMAADPTGGYWLTAADGGIFAYGGAVFHGSLAGLALASPVTGIAATGDGGGYWAFTKSGAVFNLGNAGFFGDTAGLKLNAPVVGFSAVPTTVPPVAAPVTPAV